MAKENNMIKRAEKNAIIQMENYRKKRLGLNQKEFTERIGSNHRTYGNKVKKNDFLSMQLGQALRGLGLPEAETIQELAVKSYNLQSKML